MVVVVVIREYMISGRCCYWARRMEPVLYAAKVSSYAPTLLVHVQRSSVAWTIFREHMVLWRIWFVYYFEGL